VNRGPRALRYPVLQERRTAAVGIRVLNANPFGAIAAGEFNEISTARAIYECDGAALSYC